MPVDTYRDTWDRLAKGEEWGPGIVTASATRAAPYLGVQGDTENNKCKITSVTPNSPAFPILMSNVLGYLAPQGVVQAPGIHTGDPESLVPLPQVESVRVAGPDDQTTEFKAGSGPMTYAATDVPGLYRVQQLVQGGQQTVDEDLFAANLTDRDESDIRPRLSGLASAATPTGGLATLQKEFWGVIAALVLPLLLVEWFWFHRRV